MNEDLIIELAQERDDLREAVDRQAKEIVALQAENRSLRIDLQIAKAEAKAVHDHFACDYPSPAVLDAIRTAQMHAREDTYRLRRMRTMARMLVQVLDVDNGTRPVVQELLQLMDANRR